MLLVSPTQGRDEAAIGVNGRGALSEQKPLLPRQRLVNSELGRHATPTLLRNQACEEDDALGTAHCK